MRKLHLAIVLVAATAWSGSCVRACGCSPPESIGFLELSVRDQAGMPVTDARANVVPDVGVPTFHARTGSTGDLFFAMPARRYSVTVQLPGSYARSPDQPETVSVRIAEGDTARVLYRAIRTVSDYVESDINQ